MCWAFKQRKSIRLLANWDAILRQCLGGDKESWLSRSEANKLLPITARSWVSNVAENERFFRLLFAYLSPLSILFSLLVQPSFVSTWSAWSTESGSVLEFYDNSQASLSLYRRFVNKRRDNSLSGKVFVEIAFVCWVLADCAPSFEVAQHERTWAAGDDSLLIRSNFKGGYTWKKIDATTSGRGNVKVDGRLIPMQIFSGADDGRSLTFDRKFFRQIFLKGFFRLTSMPALRRLSADE